jgi:hypothetical protein
MNTTIILTSTVNINYKKIFLNQTDPNERLQIYLKSILNWLKKTNFNVILVDNSGHIFNELDNEKNIYKNRFEVISFKETELEEAKFLEDNNSKGCSELFQLEYAFKNSRLIQQSNFLIKVTARYFINELEDYLKEFNLDSYDCLTQNNVNRCEMVGSHYNNFKKIFNSQLNDNEKLLNGHIESVYYDRTSSFSNILICKLFEIEKTKRGGVDAYFIDI